MPTKDLKEKTVAVYLYDVRKLYVGLGQVEHNIATGLARQAGKLRQQGIRLLFLVPQDAVGAYGNEVDYVGLTAFRRFVLSHRLLAPLGRLTLPHIDLLHATQQLPRIKGRVSEFRLLTIHDINFVHRNGVSPSKYRQKMRRMRRSIALSTHLSFISHFVQQDINDHFKVSDLPQRVVANGVTDLSGAPTERPEGVPDHFLFHISRLGDKKNVDLLISMMALLPHENLVIAGRGHADRMALFRQIIQDLHLTNVFLTGEVTESQRAWLYQNCRALLFPSLCEGFGLPVAEAMYCGKPVFTTPYTSLPEVGGEAAYYFDKLQADAMADCVSRGLSDFDAHPDERAALLRQQASQFTWDKCVQGYINYYLDILSE